MSTVGPRRLKNAAYEQLARVGKALAAPKRLELLDLLCQGPRTVEALADQAGASVANTSQHLRVLRGAGLVEAEKKGLYVEYRLAGDQVARVFHALRSLAASRLAEIGRISRALVTERGGFEMVPQEVLLRRVRAGDVVVLDVRPPEEYRAAHIPGALSLPLRDLRKRLRRLPKHREIVAYCRGPWCVMAIDAVELLRKHGFRAHRLEEGVVDWRARGWRIERGPGAAA